MATPENPIPTTNAADTIHSYKLVGYSVISIFSNTFIETSLAAAALTNNLLVAFTARVKTYNSHFIHILWNFYRLNQTIS